MDPAIAPDPQTSLLQAALWFLSRMDPDEWRMFAAAAGVAAGAAAGRRFGFGGRWRALVAMSVAAALAAAQAWAAGHSSADLLAWAAVDAAGVAVGGHVLGIKLAWERLLPGVRRAARTSVANRRGRGPGAGSPPAVG